MTNNTTMKNIKIINENIFNAKKVEVDFRSNGRTQNIIITWFDGKWKRLEADSEIGRYYYVEEFGFEII